MSFLPNTRLSDDEYKARHPVAFALRQAGYIPLPRLWIHGDAMPALKDLTDQYRDEINEIRGKVNQGQGLPPAADYGTLPIGIASDKTDDPRFNREAAWDAIERTKQLNDVFGG